jgi:hypothetical protein
MQLHPHLALVLLLLLLLAVGIDCLLLPPGGLL